MSYLFLIIAFIFSSLANVLLKIKAGQGFQWKGLTLLNLFRLILFFSKLISLALNFTFYFWPEKIPLSV